jgi:hypothetical protein
MYKIKNLAKKTLNRKLLEEFLDFANKKLEVDKPYSVYFVDDKSNATDPLGKTAMYNPSSSSVYVYATNRHPKDILRSIAHELMHHKQNCDGRLDKTYGEGSDDLETLELEANEAGYLVREFEDGRKELNEDTLPFGYGTEEESKRIKKLIKDKLASYGFNPNTDPFGEKINTFNKLSLRDLVAITRYNEDPQEIKKQARVRSILGVDYFYKKITSHKNIANGVVAILQDFSKIKNATVSNIDTPSKALKTAARRIYYFFDPPQGVVPGYKKQFPQYAHKHVEQLLQRLRDNYFNKAMEIVSRHASSADAINSATAGIEQSIGAWGNRTVNWWKDASFTEKKRWVLMAIGMMPPEIAATAVGGSVSLIGTPAAGAAAGSLAAIVPVASDAAAGVSYFTEEPKDPLMGALCLFSAGLSSFDAAKASRMSQLLKAENKTLARIEMINILNTNPAYLNKTLQSLDKAAVSLEKYNLPILARPFKSSAQYIRQLSEAAKISDELVGTWTRVERGQAPEWAKTGVATKGAIETIEKKTGDTVKDSVILNYRKMTGRTSGAQQIGRTTPEEILDVFSSAENSTFEGGYSLFSKDFVEEIVEQAPEASKRLDSAYNPYAAEYAADRAILEKYDALSNIAYEAKYGGKFLDDMVLPSIDLNRLGLENFDQILSILNSKFSANKRPYDLLFNRLRKLTEFKFSKQELEEIVLKYFKEESDDISGEVRYISIPGAAPEDAFNKISKEIVNLSKTRNEAEFLRRIATAGTATVSRGGRVIPIGPSVKEGVDFAYNEAARDIALTPGFRQRLTDRVLDKIEKKGKDIRVIKQQELRVINEESANELLKQIVPTSQTYKKYLKTYDSGLVKFKDRVGSVKEKLGNLIGITGSVIRFNFTPFGTKQFGKDLVTLAKATVGKSDVKSAAKALGRVAVAGARTGITIMKIKTILDQAKAIYGKGGPQSDVYKVAKGLNPDEEPGAISLLWTATMIKTVEATEEVKKYFQDKFEVDVDEVKKEIPKNVERKLIEVGVVASLEKEKSEPKKDDKKKPKKPDSKEDKAKKEVETEGEKAKKQIPKMNEQINKPKVPKPVKKAAAKASKKPESTTRKPGEAGGTKAGANERGGSGEGKGAGGRFRFNENAISEFLKAHIRNKKTVEIAKRSSELSSLDNKLAEMLIAAWKSVPKDYNFALIDNGTKHSVWAQVFTTRRDEEVITPNDYDKSHISEKIKTFFRKHKIDQLNSDQKKDFEELLNQFTKHYKKSTKEKKSPTKESIKQYRNKVLNERYEKLLKGFTKEGK